MAPMVRGCEPVHGCVRLSVPDCEGIPECACMCLSEKGCDLVYVSNNTGD